MYILSIVYLLHGALSQTDIHSTISYIQKKKQTYTLRISCLFLVFLSFSIYRKRINTGADPPT